MIGAFLDGLAIKDRPSFADWCEDNIILKSDQAPIAGPFSLDTTPYFRRIYECMDPDGDVREITLMMASQLGKTQMCMGFAMYSQCVLGGPLMFVLSTISLGQKFSKQRLGPLCDSTEAFQDVVKKNVGRAQSQSMTVKTTEKGSILIVGANSPSDLASTPIRFLLLDEKDKYKMDLSDEGDPGELAKARTENFYDAIIVNSSTPTIKGLSSIEKDFNRSTRHHYEVPCPGCGKFQRLEFERLLPEGYPCVGCSMLIDDALHKEEMLERGRWTTKDPPSQHHGFALSKMYAPHAWVTWPDLLARWTEMQGDDVKVKTFKNLALGVTYEEPGHEVDALEVKRKCVRSYELGVVPEGCVGITMAVDCQNDRLEYEVKAWLPRLNSYDIDYGIIEGNMASKEAQSELAALIDREYPTASGGRRGIEKTFIDSGYSTADVYMFCMAYHWSRVCAIKGSDSFAATVSPPRPIEVKKGKRRYSRAGGRLITVGVSILKNQIYTSLNMEEKKYKSEDAWRRMFFPSSYGTEFFNQLCAETYVKEIDPRTRKPKFIWKLKRERNEALDLNVYNLAAAYALGLHKIESSDRPKPRRRRRARGKSDAWNVSLA